MAEPDAATPASALTKREYEQLARFRYGLRRLLHFSEETVRAYGVQPQQYQLLLALKGFPDRDWATVAELAERLQIRHNSAVGLIDRCVRLGLVQRGPHPASRRSVALRLTENGDRTVAELASLHRAEIDRLRDLLAPPPAAAAAEQAPGRGDDGPNRSP